MTTEIIKRQFVIPDIHACYKTFSKLLSKIAFSHNDELYILGDMINRGNNSSAVLDSIIKMQKNGYSIFPIRGNHEESLLNIVKTGNKKQLQNYLRYYNSQDLLNSENEIKKKYLHLLESLPYYIEVDKFILVHASLDLSSDDYFANTDFMIKSSYLRGDISKIENKIIIHGHVAQPYKTIKKNIEEKSKFIGLDNACVYGANKIGYGRLVCLELNSMELYHKKNCENIL